MYCPKSFEVDDEQEILAFIAANGFGQITSMVQGRLFSTHVPFLVSEDKTKLVAHLAKQNPQWHEFEGQEVLVTFQGPHAYISPSWYEGPSVPTWNYQAVHVYGKCRVFNDADKLRAAVDMLANKYESGFEVPWNPDYQASMVNGIVGVEIDISELQCKYKLSQNRSDTDKRNVITQLEQLGAVEIAAAMKRIT